MNACPYCLSPVTEEERVICESCDAVYHAECWSENGGCCVKDCAKAARNIELDLPPTHADKLVFSRQAVEAAPQRRIQSVSNPCMRCGKPVPDGELYCDNCLPEREESQDAKNLGPLLIAGLILLFVVLLGWIIYAGSIPGPGPADETRPGVTTKTAR